MTKPLDIEALRAEFLNTVFDEKQFELTAVDMSNYAVSCGELAPRYTDPNDPDFQAPPTMATCFQPKTRRPKGFPKIAGLGMDAGKAVHAYKPIRAGVRLTGKTHMHDIYTKTGRSGRMVFFVNRMDIFDAEGEQLAWADTSVVIREKPDASERRGDS